MQSRRAVSSRAARHDLHDAICRAMTVPSLCLLPSLRRKWLHSTVGYHQRLTVSPAVSQILAPGHPAGGFPVRDRHGRRKQRRLTMRCGAWTSFPLRLHGIRASESTPETGGRHHLRRQQGCVGVLCSNSSIPANRPLHDPPPPMRPASQKPISRSPVTFAGLQTRPPITLS